jgi:hypothetical protein
VFGVLQYVVIVHVHPYLPHSSTLSVPADLTCKPCQGRCKAIVEYNDALQANPRFANPTRRGRPRCPSCFVTSWRVKAMINRLLRNAHIVRHRVPLYKAGQTQRWRLYHSFSGSITPFCAIGKQRHTRRSFTLKKSTRPRNIRRAKNSLRKVIFS